MATAGKGTLFVYLQAAPPRGRLAGFYVWGAARPPLGAPFGGPVSYTHLRAHET